MRIGNGILVYCKIVMNNLLIMRDKINRANRLYEAKPLATKNGEVIP